MEKKFINRSTGAKSGLLFSALFFFFFGSVITQFPQVFAQNVLFDFDNAPLYSSLPIDQSVNGITAHLSATGQGYSIQNANVLGFTPQGFAGRILYPNSINLSDILISYDKVLSDFSIMYCCQELGCDDAATMRVTAYMNGIYVGTNTKTARYPGTWPVDTLKCSFPQGFNSVVIHYANRPPTCQDYGVIYMADKMRVTELNISLSLDLTSIIEGFWDGISMVSDSVNVYLRDNSSPFAKIDSSVTLLNNSGNGIMTFNNASAGNYYIVVSQRNSIDTWSGMSQSFSAGGLTYYDFSTASNQSYGNNQVLKSGKYCLYSGDENKDGLVDLNDLVNIINDASVYTTGYVVTDINGDNFVDLQDLLISYDNSAIFVGIISP